MDGAEFYEDREQTLVKHEILKAYLERFASLSGRDGTQSHMLIVLQVRGNRGPKTYQIAHLPSL